jgi:hypothetical protein
VVGVVLGALAILLLAFSFGLLFFVTGPLALVALILGMAGRSRVERGLTARGRGAANAAMVLGIAGLVLSVVGLVYTALLLAGYWES